MGISQKMEADIKRDPSIRGMFNDEAFWTPTYEIGADTLTIRHVLPSFLVLAFGISFSVMVIVLEKMLCKIDITSIAKPTLQHGDIDSSKGAGESEEESAIEIVTHQGTMKIFKFRTPHSTEPTPRGTLKISKSSHTTAQGPHTWEL